METCTPKLYLGMCGLCQGSKVSVTNRLLWSFSHIRTRAAQNLTFHNQGVLTLFVTVEVRTSDECSETRDLRRREFSSGICEPSANRAIYVPP